MSKEKQKAVTCDLTVNCWTICSTNQMRPCQMIQPPSLYRILVLGKLANFGSHVTPDSCQRKLSVMLLCMEYVCNPLVSLLVTFLSLKRNVPGSIFIVLNERFNLGS